MYIDLVAQGSLSVNDALQVGKLIEETDINDLETRQVGLSADSDILYVYENLKLGSENHLDAFNRNLQNTP